MARAIPANDLKRQSLPFVVAIHTDTVNVLDETKKPVRNPGVDLRGVAVAMCVISQSIKGGGEVFPMSPKVGRSMGVVSGPKRRGFQLEKNPRLHFAFCTKHSWVLRSVCCRKHCPGEIGCGFAQRFSAASTVLMKINTTTPLVAIRGDKRRPLLAFRDSVAPGNFMRKAQMRSRIAIRNTGEFLFKNFKIESAPEYRVSYIKHFEIPRKARQY